MATKKKKSKSKKAPAHTHNHDETLLDILTGCQQAQEALSCLRREVQVLTSRVEAFQNIHATQRIEILRLEESNEELRTLVYRPFWKRIFR